MSRVARVHQFLLPPVPVGAMWMDPAAVPAHTVRCVTWEEPAIQVFHTFSVWRDCIFLDCLLYEHPWKDHLKQKAVNDSAWKRCGDIKDPWKLVFQRYDVYGRVTPWEIHSNFKILLSKNMHLIHLPYWASQLSNKAQCKVRVVLSWTHMLKLPSMMREYLLNITSLKKDSQYLKFQVWFLLNVCHFFSIVKWNNHNLGA